MNEMTLFQNDNYKIRATEINGEPWFVGKDVSDILGYQNGSRDINRHVDDEDKTKSMVFDGNQNKETILINESGLYSLVMSSKLPTAKKFKRWVTGEVLPAIRKHGAYATTETIDKIIADPEFGIRLLQELKEDRIRIAEQKKKIEEMKPKASYYDYVLRSEELIPISKIAKDYGWTGQQLNNFLCKSGIQFKRSGTWLLYKEYADKGYTHSKTILYDTEIGYNSRMHTYWTQKGRLFIYNLLKGYGYLPLMESTATA